MYLDFQTRPNCMTPEQLSLLQDANLSDEARLIGLLISTHDGEWAEYHRDDFRRLLHGVVSKDRVARALGELELHRYVERKPGGRGHGDSFKFSVRGAPTLKLISVEVAATVTPPSSTTASTSTPPIIPLSDGLAEVRDYLGDDVVDMALGCGFLPPVKLKGIYGLYGPKGMQADRVMAGLSPPDRQAALKTAVMRLVMDGKGYNNPLFEKYLSRAVTGKDTDGSNYRATGTDGRRHSGRAPAAPRGADPERGQTWVVEE